MRTSLLWGGRVGPILLFTVLVFFPVCVEGWICASLAHVLVAYACVIVYLVLELVDERLLLGGRLGVVRLDGGLGVPDDREGVCFPLGVRDFPGVVLL